MKLPPDIPKALYFDRDAVKRYGAKAKPWLVRCEGQTWRCLAFELDGILSSRFDLATPLSPAGPCAWLATSAAMTLEEAEAA